MAPTQFEPCGITTTVGLLMLDSAPHGRHHRPGAPGNYACEKGDKTPRLSIQCTDGSIRGIKASSFLYSFAMQANCANAHKDLTLHRLNESTPILVGYQRLRLMFFLRTKMTRIRMAKHTITQISMQHCGPIGCHHVRQHRGPSEGRHALRSPRGDVGVPREQDPVRLVPGMHLVCPTHIHTQTHLNLAGLLGVLDC
jgi:hypothetical protein